MKIGVIGAGSFGTALLKTFSRYHDCVVWDRDTEILEHLANWRSNPKYLKGVTITTHFEVTITLTDLASCDLIVYAVPSANLKEFDFSVFEEKYILLACKGFSVGCALPGEILRDYGIKNQFALSGPNFAKDLASGSPCASVLAGTDFGKSVELAKNLSCENLKLYPSSDIVGVQLCGALKNIYAIGSGFASGLGFGPSSIFSLLTRSLAELSRIVKHWGGNIETVFGLAGVGDIFMTGSNPESRNFRFGLMLAQGLNPEQALQSIGEAVEGYNSVMLVLQNRAKFPSDLPVLDSIIRAVTEGFSKQDVFALLQRPIKTEF